MEVPAKLDSRKVFKNKGKILGGSGGNPGEGGRNFEKKCENLTRNFDTGFEISSVGILDISQYTKYEQPRVAGKHLTRHAKNGYAAVAILATLLPMAGV